MRRFLEHRTKDSFSNEGVHPYLLGRKPNKNRTHPEVELHGRRWWMAEGDKLNLGIGQYSKDFIKGADKSEAAVQKDWLSQSLPKLHQSWVDSLPNELKPHAVEQTKWAQWRPFWKEPFGKRKGYGCGCVHHASFAACEAGVRAGRGPELHRSKQRRPEGLALCIHGHTCACSCYVCTTPSDRTKQPFLQQAVCPQEDDRALPHVACALGKCSECGIDRVP